MKKVGLVLLIVACLSFVFTEVCYADWSDEKEVQYIYVDADDRAGTFRVWRSMSTKTDDFVFAGEIPFSYDIVCKDENGEVLKTVHGRAALAVDQEEMTVSVGDIVDQMESLLDKHLSIAVEFEFTGIDEQFEACGSDFVLTGEKYIRDTFGSMGYSKEQIDELVEQQKVGRSMAKGEFNQTGSTTEPSDRILGKVKKAVLKVAISLALGMVVLIYLVASTRKKGRRTAPRNN